MRVSVVNRRAVRLLSTTVATPNPSDDKRLLKLLLKKLSEEVSVKEPKRPSSSYNLYFKDKYQGLADKTSVTAAAKSISAEWNTESEDIKKEYKAKAEQEVQKYEQSRLGYLNALKPLDVAILNKIRSINKKLGKRTSALLHHKDAPLKPLTPALAFAKNFQAQPDSVKTTKLGAASNASQSAKITAISKLWKAASPETVQKFNDEYKAARESYLKHLVEFKSRNKLDAVDERIALIVSDVKKSLKVVKKKKKVVVKKKKVVKKKVVVKQKKVVKKKSSAKASASKKR